MERGTLSFGPSKKLDTNALNEITEKPVWFDVLFDFFLLLS